LLSSTLFSQFFEQTLTGAADFGDSAWRCIRILRRHCMSPPTMCHAIALVLAERRLYDMHTRHDLLAITAVHIFSMRDYLEMSGIATCSMWATLRWHRTTSIMAHVVNFFLRRNRPLGQFIGFPMCPTRFAPPMWLCAVMKTAIAIRQSLPLPWPTCVRTTRAIHCRPEAFCFWQKRRSQGSSICKITRFDTTAIMRCTQTFGADGAATFLNGAHGKRSCRGRNMCLGIAVDLPPLIMQGTKPLGTIRTITSRHRAGSHRLLPLKPRGWRSHGSLVGSQVFGDQPSRERRVHASRALCSMEAA